MGKVKFFWTLPAFLLFCIVLTITAGATELVSSEEDLSLNSQASFLLDLDSNSVLYSHNADEIREPASLTKVMTALLIIEHGSLDEMTTVSQSALDSLYANSSAEFSTLADLVVGEQMSMRNLLYCILVSSSSDACCVAAEAVAGSVDAFVELMNQRAADLGCRNTHFANPHGLHEDNHYTTAADMATITLAALQYDSFVEICNTPSVEIPATNMHGLRYLKTTNYLLTSNTVAGYVYSRACGVKTGYTSQAGYCLISTAQNSRMSLLGVVMGAGVTKNFDETYTIHSFTDMVTLFEYGFDHFTSAFLLSSLDMITEVPVTLAAGGVDVAVLSPVRSVSTMLPVGYDTAQVRREITLTAEQVEAPVDAGQIMGSVAVYYGDQLIDTVELAAISDIERSELQFWKQQLLLYLENPWVKLVAGIVVALFILYLIRLAFPSRKKRHHR